MQPIAKNHLAALLTGMLPMLAKPAETAPQALSLTQLEQRLEEIDSELETLAHFSLRSGAGSIGFRSQPHDAPDHPEWIQINFDAETPIDQIVLVPAIYRHIKRGFVDDGFPSEFRILAGAGGDTNGTVIATKTANEQMLPRIAPLIVSCPASNVAWIRIEATKLSTRYFDGKHIFQLSEILVFDGEKNVALHQQVTASSPSRSWSTSWRQQHVVDGFMPYLMHAAEGAPSLPFVSTYLTNIAPSFFTVDLGESHPLSRIHLHAVDQNDTVPESSPGDFAIPRWLVAEGANKGDFSDAVELMQYRVQTVYQTSPIMMWNIPETACRYVRLTVLEPFVYPYGKNSEARARIGFAEIELFSKGTNVALGQDFSSDILHSNTRSMAALTDGNNLYGKLLDTRIWLEELARRHDLEIERPQILAERNLRYTRQKTNLRRLAWLTGLLVAGTITIIIIEQFLRQRAVYRTRERIAANLHDELGANLHAIGLLGGHATDQLEKVEARSELAELVDTLNDIRTFTEQAGAATRYCINMLECPGLYENLPMEMQRIAKRLLVDIAHESSFENTAMLGTLNKRACIDLYLFYKECLTNILRHASATQVSTKLIISDKELQLTVSDDGRGMGRSKGSALPKALKRRARLLRAQLDIQSSAGGGTTVKLSCPLRKIRLKRRRSNHGQRH
jgi:signal transduction histidine kinase